MNNQEMQELLNDAYDTLSRHFDSREQFVSQFKSINTDDQKNKFLRLISFYKNLVKDSRFTIGDEGEDRLAGFVNDSFRYVALMSVIEALYSEEKYKRFYEWLSSSNQKSKFSITSQKKLIPLFNDYNEIHGSTRKVVRFFKDIPQKYHWVLHYGIRQYKINNKTSKSPGIAIDKGANIEALAKSLFQIRSDFVHAAKLVVEFSGTPTFSKRGSQHIITKLPFDNLCILFEIGMLNKFEIKFNENVQFPYSPP